MSESQTALRALPPEFTRAEFRKALGQFATGVTVVTACTPQGHPVGLTVNSFNSVSLEPPLVLWSLSCASASMQALLACQHYAINVLSAQQQALALRFAAKDVDRFAQVAFHTGLSGAPLLEGAVASFECFNRSRYPEGDHVIFVGEVERCVHHPHRPPLLYHSGRFHTELPGWEG